jgi:hypothetical protein
MQSFDVTIPIDFSKTHPEMNEAIRHLTAAELEAGLDHIRQAPKDRGVLQLIVRRPTIATRETLTEANLDLVIGLVGDNWKSRGNPRLPRGLANPDAQITVMNSRAAALIAQVQERWPLAGDQLYIEMDLGVENLPPGTQIAIGSAIIEVTAEPHTGCKKFTHRFGLAAMKFVNSPEGRKLNLRGINAKVVQPGTIRLGDIALKRGRRVLAQRKLRMAH